MYSIWVKDKFKDVKSVKLVWHMLAFNKEAVSERTDEQLEKLEDETISLIRKIEKAEKEKDFPTNITALCNYCGFKSQCPSFKHQIELDKKAEESVEKFKQDDGLKIVDEFSELKIKLKELTDKKEELEGKLIEFAKQFKVDIVYGSNNMAKVKEIEKVLLPEDEKEKAKFIQLLKDKGFWEEFSMICYPKISSKVLKNEMDKDLRSMITLEDDFRVSLAKRKDVEDE